jgi:ABC-type spermidine/putrescine transport system permease subunit II
MIFLFAPSIVVIVYSFNGQRSLTVLSGLSLRWYRQFLSDPDLRGSLLLSIEIATVVALAAGALGTLQSLGLLYAKGRTAAAGEGIVLMRLVAPEIACAVAAMLLFQQIHVALSVWTVILTHITFSIPFVTIIVQSRLSRLDPGLEEAAMDLGCTWWKAVRLVILPQLWPAVLAGSLLVFVFSFDDFVSTYFTSGVGLTPLPLRIYGMLKFGLSPVINAVGTFMMALSMVLALLAVLVLRGRSTRRRANVEAGPT